MCRDSSIAYVQNVYVYEGAMCVATPICLIHMNIHKYEGVMCVATPLCAYHDSFLYVDILDICSSWVSHYPLEFKQTMSRISGTGMNNFELRCVAVCCSVLQCVAVCCSVLQCAAVCCSVLQCAAVCCCVVQCGALWCSVLQCGAVC